MYAVGPYLFDVSEINIYIILLLLCCDTPFAVFAEL